MEFNHRRPRPMYEYLQYFRTPNFVMSGSKATRRKIPWQRPPGHATRGDKAAPPGRDAVHMVCGPSGPELMTHLATASLGISQCRLGIPNKKVTKPRLESFEDTSFSVFQIAPAHLPKVRPAQPQLFHYSTSINHNFPHLHPLQAEPSKATPQLE